MSASEALDRLRRGEPLVGVQVAFLNLDRTEFAGPVVARDCELAGFVARATRFVGEVRLEGCSIEERIETGTAKVREGPTSAAPTRFEAGLVMTDCQIRGELGFRGAVFGGPVRMERLVADQGVRFTRAELASFHLSGPSRLAAGLNLYRAQVHGRVEINGIEVAPGAAVDLNGLRAGGLSVTSCRGGSWSLHRGRIGDEGRGPALHLRDTTLEELSLVETLVNGPLSWAQVTVTGAVDAGATGERRSLLVTGDADLADCQFDGPFTFAGARFARSATFRACTFGQEATFNGVEHTGRASYGECRFLGVVSFKGARFADRASFVRASLGTRPAFNRARFDADVNMYSVEVGGDLFLGEAQFDGALSLNQARIDGGLSLKGTRVDGVLNLRGTTLADRLILTGGTYGGLIAAPLLVGTWAGLDACTFRGPIDASGLRVGTATANKPAPEGVVPGSAYFDGTRFEGAVVLTAAWVAGDLSLQNVDARDGVRLERLGVGSALHLTGSVWRERVVADGVRVARKLDAHGARFGDEVNFDGLRCEAATFRGASFERGLSLARAQIEDHLVLSEAHIGGKADLVHCRAPRLFFDELIVDVLLVDDSTVMPMVASERAGNYDRAVQEYRILTGAYHQRSLYREMDWAYYRFCVCRRRRMRPTWQRVLGAPLRWGEWLLLDLGMGYGTRPLQLGFVAAGVIGLFAAIYRWAGDGIDGPNGPMTSISWLDAVHLSIASFASTELGEAGPRLGHPMLLVFDLESLIGVSLVTVFIAMVSRKIIRA